MDKLRTAFNIFLGWLIKYLYPKPPVKNHIIIGSSSGRAFSDNGMHLFKFAFSEHYENVYFVTASFSLYNQLKKRFGKQILFNYSLSGIKKILSADAYFFTHNRGDVLFIHNKKTQKICMFHGMPIKCVGTDYHGPLLRKNKLITSLYNKFVVGFSYIDYDLIVSTASFFNPFLASAWKNEKIKVMSYPRINYLQDQLKKKVFDNNTPRRIVYMPTHRSFGFGELNPLIFNNDPTFKNFLYSNNYEIKYRFHPNMKKKIKETFNDERIIREFDEHDDAQDVLLNADILISDFSSCVFDYLVCEKPIIFYHYDNYAEEDNPVYFDVQSLGIGPVVKCEDDLKAVIREIITNNAYKSELINTIRLVKNKYIDTIHTNGWSDYMPFFKGSKAVHQIA